MKKLGKWGPFIKLIVGLLLFAAAASIYIKMKIDGEAGLEVRVMFVLSVLTAVNFLYRVHVVFGSGAGGRRPIRTFFKKLFRTVLDKLIPKDEDDKKYLRGKSEREFVFEGGLFDRLKRIFDTRVKANPSRCRENGEKVRMMYIRRVLKLCAEGCEVTPAKTPRELENYLDPGESPALFETRTVIPLTTKPSRLSEQRNNAKSRRPFPVGGDLFS